MAGRITKSEDQLRPDPRYGDKGRFEIREELHRCSADARPLPKAASMAPLT